MELFETNAKQTTEKFNVKWNHYDASGRKVGESRPGILGGMNHYDD